MRFVRFPFQAPDADPANPGTGGADKPADLAVTLAAVQAELAQIKADRDAERTAAEQARAEAVAAAQAEAASKLTDAERQAAELAEVKALLAAQELSARELARTSLLDSLGADPAYRRVFPEGDARVPQVKARIERFAADHPRLLTRQPGPPQPNVPDMDRLLKGRPLGTLVNQDAVRASFEALEQIRGR